MIDRGWKRTEYDTWDEAFRALVPIIRQQSVRVAEYTQTLFTCAVSASYGKGSRGSDAMSGRYADTAYKCGLYHQLGKALVPPEYQVYQKDFTDEEIAVYRKYTVDGRALVASLQEKGARSKEKRRAAADGEIPTKNIPWLMVREACEMHMERYDGSGYPAGLRAGQISPIAHIVGFAKELDRLSSETRLERPFDEAMRILDAESGSAWDPELISVVRKNADKLRAVYEKFIHYTMTLPETIPLVVRREGRPLYLSYRPMTNRAEGDPVAYEAIPRFGGIAGAPGETESAAEVEEMLNRTDLIGDVTFYFLYEAADTVLRLENCGIESRGVLVNVLPSFYRRGSQLQGLTALFRDQPIPREKLMLTYPAGLVRATKALDEQVSRYARNGVTLVLDGYRPSAIPADYIRELGFRYVRLDPELYLDRETGDALKKLREGGISFIGGDVADRDAFAWLEVLGAEFISGPITGALCDDEGLIREALARANS